MYKALSYILFASVIILLYSSCSIIFLSYIRNHSKDQATLNVYLKTKNHLATLPNSYSYANEIVTFKTGFRKRFTSSSYVNWQDTSHFTIDIPPNTTINLEDIVGTCMNGGFKSNFVATITANNRTDTLLYGNPWNSRNKFEYTKVGVSLPVLYYDIK